MQGLETQGSHVTPPRRDKLVLAVALVGLGVWAWKPVWWWAMTEKRYTTHSELVYPKGADAWLVHDCRGFSWRTWSGTSGARQWYVDSGFMCRDWYIDDQRITEWDVNGALVRQGLVRERTAPPWFWGVTDQTEPSIPAWMKDDAKWQAALDAQE